MRTIIAPESRTPRSSFSWRSSTKLGLEIGDHEAHMVVCRERASGWEVLRAGRLALPAPFEEAPSEATAAIAQWLRREGGAQPGNLVATLPTSLFEYESAPVSAAEVEGQQSATTAHQLMTELLGDELEQASYDYWVSQSPMGPKLHLAWATRAVLVQVAEGLSRCGWRISAFDLPIVALARLAQFSNAPESQLIVELNSKEANFVWSSHGEPRYLRTRISLGNQSPTAIVAARRRISVATAETSLSRWGVDRHTMPPLAELHEACLNDWLERLSYEIHRTMQFIHGGMPPATAPGVVLCGCSADIRGLTDWLSSHLKLGVSVATLPERGKWLSAEPYRGTYALALANSRHGVML
ncbi:MAG: hypothetical protein Q8M16_07605 [Pirellulaceae bacterium]|nr:hypothetical protein [Pirellulaceae bacterium]